MLDRLITDRRYLHTIPETRFELPKTKAYILSRLAGLKCEISFAAESGVAAFFDADKPETVAFRADMDALDVTEISGCGFESVHPGKMHACGHDAHMAMLLETARWANENIAKLPRNVLLIFQPSEESGAGGALMAECEAFLTKNVTRVFAIHVEPALPLGVIATRKGAHLARASELRLKFHGRAGHAAIPGAGADALEAAVEFVHAAYEMERALGADAPRRLKFCMFQSGNTTNVIPGEAFVMGTLRTFDEDTDKYIKLRLDEIARAAAENVGATHEFDIFDGYPAVINDSALVELAKRVYPVADIPEPTYIGEDFSYYQKKAPGVMFRLGLGTDIPLHSANFVIDERALVSGVELFRALAAAE